MGCYNRAKGFGCEQRTVYLDVLEDQVLGYLKKFHIPEDYQEQILMEYRKLRDAYDDVEEQRWRLQAQLERIRDLYKWGDIDKAEYQREKQQIESELARITPFQVPSEHLKRLAEFLSSITKAWDTATNEQRNKLTRTLFEEIWVKDQEVVFVKPRPEFEPFFKLNWEQFCEVMKLQGRIPSGSPLPYL